MRVALVATVLMTAACPGRYKEPAGTGPRGNGSGVGPVKGVESAALPYAIVDGRSGRAVTEPELWAALASARAVCVGEEHPNPHHHWAQLTIVGSVADKLAGKKLALGMEMVQAPFQGVLDDWAAQKIDEAALLSRTGWADRWGYDFALYRPILERARKGGMALVALNAPRELVKAVAKKGVDGLSADERAKLPPLVLDDAQHRAWFDGIMAGMEDGHGHGEAKEEKEEKGGEGEGEGESGTGTGTGPDPDNIYAAQVVWDESMAEGARRWLGGGGDTMVIIAGVGHCHDSAIVRRLVRRGGGPAVSIRPIIDDGEGNVAAALAEAQNDYLFVMTMPSK
ncbi:MAG TPA: ChaN family lipoprotein [Kofleriaceae bacterium]|nr:ChaN family lipoprotein [Kofleriaceae bacterium]